MCDNCVWLQYIRELQAYHRDAKFDLNDVPSNVRPFIKLEMELMKKKEEHERQKES